MQGVVQSAFLWGYMGTNVLGGKLADVYGGNPCKCCSPDILPLACPLSRSIPHAGKVVMAYSIAWFSLACCLLPLALSRPVRASYRHHYVAWYMAHNVCTSRWRQRG